MNHHISAALVEARLADQRRATGHRVDTRRPAFGARLRTFVRPAEQTAMDR